MCAALESAPLSQRQNADGLVQTRAVHSRLLELEWPPARTPILFTDHDAEHNEYFWCAPFFPQV